MPWLRVEPIPQEVLMVSLTIDLPEEAFSALRIGPDQFAKELRSAPLTGEQ